MAITRFFTSTAQVLMATKGKTAGGGVQKTFTERIAALKCRISERRPFEQFAGGKLVVIRRFRLYCAASSTNKAIKHADRIVNNGITYAVEGVANPAGLDRHLQLDITAVD